MWNRKLYMVMHNYIVAYPITSRSVACISEGLQFRTEFVAFVVGWDRFPTGWKFLVFAPWAFPLMGCGSDRYGFVSYDFGGYPILMPCLEEALSQWCLPCCCFFVRVFFRWVGAIRPCWSSLLQDQVKSAEYQFFVDCYAKVIHLGCPVAPRCNMIFTVLQYGTQLEMFGW